MTALAIIVVYFAIRIFVHALMTGHGRYSN
jgi:hypothetical protein